MLSLPSPEIMRVREIQALQPHAQSSFPWLIAVPLSGHEVDGVRKEKERLTAAMPCQRFLSHVGRSSSSLHEDVSLNRVVRRVGQPQRQVLAVQPHSVPR